MKTSTAKGARTRLLLTFFAAVTTLAILACERRDDDDRDECPPQQQEKSTCISGQQVSCPCADGTTSVQICAAGGYFSNCQCASAPDAGFDADDDAATNADTGTSDADAADDGG